MPSSLDTSGEVVMPAIIEMTGEPDAIALSYRWRDLDPFTQGYVEALFQSVVPVYDAGATVEMCMWEAKGFSDLAPETLAAILKDCARFTELFGEWPLHDHGKHFWIGRQKDKHPDFPPLTPTLSEDGKIYLRSSPDAQ